MLTIILRSINSVPNVYGALNCVDPNEAYGGLSLSQCTRLNRQSKT
jgi:hypothetical protein